MNGRNNGSIKLRGNLGTALRYPAHDAGNDAEIEFLVAGIDPFR